MPQQCAEEPPGIFTELRCGLPNGAGEGEGSLVKNAKAVFVGVVVVAHPIAGREAKGLFGVKGMHRFGEILQGCSIVNGNDPIALFHQVVAQLHAGRFI